MAQNLEKTTDVVYFGRTDFRNTNRLFGIKRRDRRQHMYVVGKTGTGKSALLKNMAIQDIMNGEGLCVIDPHGEFVESLLERVPEARLNDVIYFNPADPDYHIGFNPLELPDQRYKHLVASGLMAIFTKIWANVWSARMEYIMNNAILALLENPGSTMLGINRILVDKDYRQQIVANVKDPVVKAFWINEYETWRDQFRNEAIAPIQNKVGQFLSTSMIRNIVGQTQSTINIFDIMNQGKILLVNVSKGRIGEDNSALLGAMLITIIQLAAMERVRIPEDERRDFYLYVDEFQNFATDSFAGILSEARKYRLNLILAHQYVGQLVTDVSTKVRDAVFGNAGSMIMFRIGAADAEFLENEFTPEFMIQDMVNLPNYCVYLKLMVDGVTCRPFSAATIPPFKVSASAATAEKIIEASREKYARPREEVETEIIRWSGSMGALTDEGAPPREARGGGRAAAYLGVTYSAVCSSCGKTTELNFKPTEGRPIYCRDCLQKVKTGEMEPVRVGKVKAPREQTRYMSDLGALGIEFEGSPHKHSKHDPVLPHAQGLAVPHGFREARREERVEPQSTPPVLHLSALKESDVVRQEKGPRQKKQTNIDIDELRDAVKAALHTSLEKPPPHIPGGEEK